MCAMLGCLNGDSSQCGDCEDCCDLQDVAEYAIMLAVVLVIVAGTVRMIGANASTVFSQMGSDSVAAGREC